MQMAVIEFARNVAGLKEANSVEINAKTPDPVIHIMPGQEKLIKEKAMAEQFVWAVGLV